ncbi:hypothetical protein AX774_g6686 [Zancudomyces culisetae]|uniref:FAS1 domain-containing protein n=1 Tax=Zancudomyces culisetae TaxID=1213189 RepID=A0A1R1PG38_ZANCU|nr:hypothetical protein AX774_g6686 [Zancudomyces culisetae]|eukprot:OMH79889.1 hypothetical protein AX774_g6686 [Zancudomyces culisetae]
MEDQKKDPSNTRLLANTKQHPFGGSQDVKIIDVDVENGPPTLNELLAATNSASTAMDAFRVCPKLAQQISNQNEQITILAPTNAAFKEWKQAPEPEYLCPLMSRHILPGIQKLESLKAGTVLPTLNADTKLELMVASNGGGTVYLKRNQISHSSIALIRVPPPTSHSLPFLFLKKGTGGGPWLY